MPVNSDAFTLRVSALLLFVLAGLLSGASGLYMLGGFSNGLPSAWWSGLLVSTVVGASGVLVAAGLLTFYSQGVARVLVLVGGGLLELVFAAAVLEMVISTGSANVRTGVAWGPFVLLLVLPLLLTTASLLVAWRSR